MKNLKLSMLGMFLFIGATACSTQSDTKDVPAAVKQAFSQRFATAKKVTWEKRKRPRMGGGI